MLGQSFALDFLLHTGMGFAAASTLLVAVLKPPFIETKTFAPWLKNLLGTAAGLLIMGSQIAIVAFMGAAKGIAANNSIVGYVVGVVGLLGVAWLVRPIHPS